MVTATVRAVSAARGLDHLGCYVLPGGVPDPRPGLQQARVAEDLGLGTAWISERYDTKDLPSLAGAIGQVTERIRHRRRRSRTRASGTPWCSRRWARPCRR